MAQGKAGSWVEQVQYQTPVEGDEGREPVAGAMQQGTKRGPRPSNLRQDQAAEQGQIAEEAYRQTRSMKQRLIEWGRH